MLDIEQSVGDVQEGKNVRVSATVDCYVNMVLEAIAMRQKISKSAVISNIVSWYILSL